MSANTMGIGVDYSFIYYDGNTASTVDLGDVQNVKITPHYHDISSEPYNAVPRFDYVPAGWSISMTITRTTPALENFIINLDKQFNAGLALSPGYLNESIANPDGTRSNYQYSKFVFRLSDHGDVDRKKPVTMTLNGKASDRVQIA
jgi:hypothetical protein